MVGQTISHYRVVEKLGAGGMGVVYKARDTHLDRLVAIKVLPPEKVADPERKRRFVQEAKAASALNHPNIITIYDIDAADGVDFIAMEYVPGKTLEQLIRRKGLPVSEALKYAIQIADALARAHGAGIVHRDLKPSNIMVDEHGLVKVLDFGLAKLTEPGPSGEDEPTRTIQAQTEEGAIVGTIAYMSPEQAQGLKVDARSDIFSFGAVLYEMLSGRRAFQGETKLSTLTAILREDPKPVSEMVKGVPADLDRIVSKALVKAPGDRYQHTDDLLVDLKGALKRLETVPPQPQRRRRLKLWPVLVAAAALVLVVVGFYLARERQAGRKTLSSIAVLPLENLSGDAAQEWFSDGMTEALIAELSKIQALKVISRTSVMQYKKARKPLKQIARELDVEAVVEGSALLVKDRVRITAQLIEASADRHLWAESYERDLQDVLSLQQEVAQAIAKQIQIKLTPQEQVRLAGARQVNPEVYTLCLKGRYYTMQFSREGLRQGFEYLNQAIRMDPRYGPAYGWLAYGYVVAADWYMPSTEAMPKAKALALKAVEMDEAASEGHSALARVYMGYDWDWGGAEREFRRAIQLNPGEPFSRYGYGGLLFSLKRFDESLAQMKRAQELDPLSPVVLTGGGLAFYFARQYDRAIEQLRAAIELEPAYFWAHTLLAMAYEQKGEARKAIAEFQKARKLSQSPFTQANLAHGYAMAGNRAEALKLVAELEEDCKRLCVAPYDVAAVYAGLGEKDQALTWLAKAYATRSWFMPWLQIDARFDGLRSDPRFQDLVRRMGFPQ